MNVRAGLYHLLVEPEGFSSVFRKSEATAKRIGCLAAFEKHAKRAKYRSWQDWLLCRLWPEYKAECRAYYKGKGRRFADLHRGATRHIDAVMSRCIAESARIAKDGGKT